VNTQGMKRAVSTNGPLFKNHYTMPATRASYQDSNIFGNKRNDSPTVQQSAKEKYAESPMNRTMLNPSKTYKSSINVYKPEVEIEYTRKKQIKDTTYVDGRKMVIGGSSTRNEKNW
jgi:hypothetical protein